MQTTEEWRDVPGYEGCYQVSNLGRVRSVDRTIQDSIGRSYPLKGKVLAPAPNRGGYLICAFTTGNKPSTFAVHRLVARVFLGPRPPGKEVHHKDGVKSNNAAANLTYVSRLENIRHAYATGLVRPHRGETHVRARLTWHQVQEIRRLYGTGEYTFKQLASKYGVSLSTVSHAYRGRNWRRDP